jgi:hypothetical protein
VTPPGVPLAWLSSVIITNYFQKLCKFLVDLCVSSGRFIYVMTNTTPHVHNVSFVFASELFENLSGSVQNQLWDDCPYSFGDCGFSLLNSVHVEHWIEDTLDFDELSDQDKATIEDIFRALKEYDKKNINIDIEG